MNGLGYKEIQELAELLRHAHELCRERRRELLDSLSMLRETLAETQEDLGRVPREIRTPVVDTASREKELTRMHTEDDAVRARGRNHFSGRKSSAALA